MGRTRTGFAAVAWVADEASRWEGPCPGELARLSTEQKGSRGSQRGKMPPILAASGGTNFSVSR